ncbi:serine hydrolase domain-containing protein [Sandaracinobacteroides sp. A072]|uniref:serine hydrolase domain-containing protein n=1 Tax=Sandaracinobacteroides sp. A072 TaxID=3461146 RepID=UPI00404273A8
MRARRRRRTSLCLAAGLFLAVIDPASASPLPEGPASVRMAGLAVAVVRPDGRLLAEAEGAAALTPEGDVLRHLGPETAVRVASVSKLVVALAIHRLADMGRLKLDDDAGLHLGWALRNPAHPQTPVTIRQLLRHQSSLSDAGGYSFPLGERLRDRLSPASWSSAMPGERFDYANINHAILGELIEAVTGMRFDRAMARLVLQPLQLDACFNWSGCTAETVAGGAVLYRKSPDGGESWAPEGPWVAQVDAERPAGGCPVRTRPGAGCDLASYRPGDNGSLFSPQGGLRISVAGLARLGWALVETPGAFLSGESLDALFRLRPVAATGAGAETDAGLMQYWSDGGLHCLSGSGNPGGDQPGAPTPTSGCGHLGEAYGLHSALLVDRTARTVRAWVITGTSEKPAPGMKSRFSIIEEHAYQKSEMIINNMY